MNEKEQMQQELKNYQERLSKISDEIDALEKVFEPKTGPLYARIDEIENLIETKKNPFWFVFIKPAKIVLIILAVLTLLASSLLAALPFAVLAIGLFIFEPMIKKNFGVDNTLEENEIKSLEAQIDDIYASEPRIAELERERSDILSKTSELSNALKEIELTEKLGVNNVFVYVSRKIESRKHGVKFDLDRGANIKLDGTDRGMAAYPFNIISLTSGIHSISVIFDLDSKILTTFDEQFSLQNNNKYYYFEVFLNDNDSYESAKIRFDNRSDFLKKIGMTEAQFNDHIRKL